MQRLSRRSPPRTFDYCCPLAAKSRLQLSTRWLVSSSPLQDSGYRTTSDYLGRAPRDVRLRLMLLIPSNYPVCRKDAIRRRKGVNG